MEVSLQQALISGGFAVLVAVVTWVAARGKNKADAVKSITEAATSLIKPLSDRLDEQGIEIEELKKKVQELERKVRASQKRIRELAEIISKLVDQVLALGHKPVAELPCWVKELDEEE